METSFININREDVKTALVYIYNMKEASKIAKS